MALHVAEVARVWYSARVFQAIASVVMVSDTRRVSRTRRGQVRRGGVASRVHSVEIVVGDVIELTPGCVVPADCRIVENPDRGLLVCWTSLGHRGGS